MTSAKSFIKVNTKLIKKNNFLDNYLTNSFSKCRYNHNLGWQ